MSRRHVFRVHVRFSADGRHAACLATGGRGGTCVEGFALTPDGPRRRLRAPVPRADQLSVFPLPDGRVLLSGSRDGQPQLALVGATGAVRWHPVPELRVAAAPPGRGLAWALVPTPAGTTEVRQLGGDLAGAGAAGPRVAEAAGALRGQGVVAGDRVVFHAWVAGAAVPVVVDPATGGVTRLPLPPPVRAAVPLHARGDTLLVGAAVAGGHRLAALSLRDPDRFVPLAGLDRLDGVVSPLALDPTGTEVVLRLRHGIRCRLLRHRPATGWTGEIAVPAGTAARRAAWTEHGLWLPFTTTTAPPRLWWLPPGQARLRPPPGEPPPAGQPGRVETLPGPAGPVEAVGYGDWRTADRVVLVLHGGPSEHWPLAFDPGLQALAAAGLAVLALNPRGSTGYGRAYEEAIKGAWGGPDLADLVAAGRHLVRVRGGRRRRPALYGTSYGAFLALLATAAAPRLWSGCVAVAPFRSAARLYASAGPPVRALLDRLDGTAVLADRLGPRDLVRLAPRMRGRILVVHGAQDPTIPVAHSRELVAALAGGSGAAVTYRELTGRGHRAVSRTPDDPEFAEIVRFLGGELPSWKGGDHDGV